MLILKDSVPLLLGQHHHKACPTIRFNDTSDLVRVLLQGLIMVEARRCIYGHELEGYTQANEEGDVEMVGGSHEERLGLTSLAHNGVLHDLGDDDDDEELTMVRAPKYAKD